MAHPGHVELAGRIEGVQQMATVCCLFVCKMARGGEGDQRWFLGLLTAESAQSNKKAVRRRGESSESEKGCCAWRMQIKRRRIGQKAVVRA